MTKRATTGGIVAFGVLLVLTLTFLYPFYYMAINSLKGRVEYYKNPFALPHHGLQFVNYTSMISQFGILRLFANTFIVGSLTVLLIIVVSTLASYTFAKYTFKGRDTIYLIVLATMFIPIQVTVIPLYVMFAHAKLVNTFWSVVFALSSLYLPEAILLMTANFRAIPNELIEASELDGCSYLEQIRHVVLPTGRAAVFLAVIFYFVQSWNSLFAPMIFLQSMGKRTIMVALASLIGRYSGSPSLQFAGLLLSALPAVIVYLIFQRRIIAGLSMGAIK